MPQDLEALSDSCPPCPHAHIAGKTETPPFLCVLTSSCAHLSCHTSHMDCHCSHRGLSLTLDQAQWVVPAAINECLYKIRLVIFQPHLLTELTYKWAQILICYHDHEGPELCLPNCSLMVPFEKAVRHPSL